MFERWKTTIRAARSGIPMTQPFELRDAIPDVEFVADIHGTEQLLTDNMVVVSLYPLRFACGFPVSGGLRVPEDILLRVREVGTRRRLLATLHLRRDGVVNHKDMKLGIYECIDCRDTILPPSARFVFAVRELLKRRRISTAVKEGKNEERFDAFGLFNLKPRPVVLVSVAHDSYSNLFPMALIGPVKGDSSYFTYALRSTSHSVQKLKAAGRFAVGDVPFTHVEEAQSLGKHHKNSVVDWDGLGYDFVRSERFDLKLPSWSLEIRELAITGVETIGSHHVFFVETVSSKRLENFGAGQFAQGNGRRLWAKKWRQIGYEI